MTGRPSGSRPLHTEQRARRVRRRAGRRERLGARCAAADVGGDARLQRREQRLDPGRLAAVDDGEREGGAAGVAGVQLHPQVGAGDAAPCARACPAGRGRARSRRCPRAAPRASRAPASRRRARPAATGRQGPGAPAGCEAHRIDYPDAPSPDDTPTIRRWPTPATPPIRRPASRRRRRSPACACSTCRASSPARGAPRCSPTSAPTSSRSSGRPATAIPAATTPAAGARPSCKDARRPRNRRGRLLPRHQPQQALDHVDLAHARRRRRWCARWRARCDVLVENFKVGDMARHGLDAASLLALNPRLVYCSITGFGQTGPYRERAGYDYAIQGMGGLMSVTGPSRAEIADDAPGGGPQKVGVAVADLFTGMYAATAILAALRHRDAHRPGPGDRHGAARHPGRDARQPRRRLPRHRRRAAARRQRAPEHRAVPGVRGRPTGT